MFRSELPPQLHIRHPAAHVKHRLARSLAVLRRNFLITVIACAGVASALLSLHAQSTVAAQAEAGWRALGAGDSATAARIFFEALSRSPRDAQLNFGAGVAAHLLGRDRDAVESLRRAVELDPKLVEASGLLGQIHYGQGELDAAIAVYEQALAQTPWNRTLQSKLEEWKKEAAVHRTLERWNSRQFSVIFEGRSDAALATRALAVLDAAYLRIGKAIGAYPSDRIVVALYTEQQFRDITHLPQWVDGAFDGRIRMPVSGASKNLVQFDRVLTHELTHAMVHGLAQGGVPAWLHEGLASYFEPGDPALAARRVKSFGAVIPLSQLQGGFINLPEAGALLAYEESLVAADVLVRRLGEQTSILIQYLGKGYSVDDALDLLGVDPADFQNGFYRRLR